VIWLKEKGIEFFIKYTKEVMEKNLSFLLEKCSDVLDSCFELLNDIIDYSMLLLPRTSSEEVKKAMLSKYMMYPMLYNVIYPNAQYACVAILQGAIPQAYYCLRTLIEAMAIAVYADTHPKLKDLNWDRKIEEKGVRNATLFGIKDSLRKMFTKVFGNKRGNEYLELLLHTYESLSAWIHPVAKIRIESEQSGEEYAAGLLKAIVLTWNKHGIPPSYGILIPMEYNNADVEDLRYLKENIEAVRLSLAILTYVWSIDKDVDKEGVGKLLERIIKESS